MEKGLPQMSVEGMERSIPIIPDARSSARIVGDMPHAVPIERFSEVESMKLEGVRDQLLHLTGSGIRTGAEIAREQAIAVEEHKKKHGKERLFEEIVGDETYTVGKFVAALGKVASDMFLLLFA